MALVFRREQRSYLNTGTAELPVWSLMGEGFTDLSTDFGANEDERHYVHEKTARTITTGFTKTISFAMDMYSTDPACLRVAKAFDEEQVGNDAEVEILTVKYFVKGEEADSYFAKRQKYSIAQGAEGEGNGGNVYEHSGTFNALGDPVLGSWSGTIEAGGTGTFTPRAA